MLKAKYTRAVYNDDGVEILGLLIRRWLRRPLFVPFDTGCGFHSQTIYKADRGRLRDMCSENSASEYQPEICPACNNLSLKYSERRDFLSGFDYPWECMCCGASGAESYSVHFTGHELITTASDRNSHS